MTARFVCLGIFALALCNALLAKLWMAPHWSALGFLLFVALLLGLRSAAPRALVLLAPIFLLWLSELLSGILIEHGAYLSEAQRYGSATGGFAFLSALYAGLALAMAAIIEWILRRLEADRHFAAFRVGDWPMLILAGVFILSSGYALAVGAREGFPILSGADRLAFRAALNDPLFEAWHSNRFMLSYFMGMVAAGGQRAVGLMMAVGLTGISLLFGEKFTSLLLILCAFLAVPGLVYIARSGRLPLGRALLPVLALAAVTLPAIFTVYGGAERAPAAMSKMSDRFALQGQAWYLIEKSATITGGRAAEIFAADARSWLVPSQQNPETAGASFGHYHVMKRIAPYAVFDDFYTNGVGFVFLLFPYLYLIGGLGGVVAGGLLLCAMTAALLALMAIAASRRDYLSTLIATKIFVWQTAGFLLGYLWFFVGIKAILLFVAFGFCRALHSRLWSKKISYAGTGS
jgi:Family of unknown function (DUF6418)